MDNKKWIFWGLGAAAAILIIAAVLVVLALLVGILLGAWTSRMPWNRGAESNEMPSATITIPNVTIPESVTTPDNTQPSIPLEETGPVTIPTTEATAPENSTSSGRGDDSTGTGNNDKKDDGQIDFDDLLGNG